MISHAGHGELFGQAPPGFLLRQNHTVSARPEHDIPLTFNECFADDLLDAEALEHGGGELVGFKVGADGAITNDDGIKRLNAHRPQGVFITRI